MTTCGFDCKEPGHQEPYLCAECGKWYIPQGKERMGCLVYHKGGCCHCFEGLVQAPAPPTAPVDVLGIQGALQSQLAAAQAACAAYRDVLKEADNRLCGHHDVNFRGDECQPCRVCTDGGNVFSKIAHALNTNPGAEVLERLKAETCRADGYKREWERQGERANKAESALAAMTAERNDYERRTVALSERFAATDMQLSNARQSRDEAKAEAADWERKYRGTCLDASGLLQELAEVRAELAKKGQEQCRGSGHYCAGAMSDPSPCIALSVAP